MRLYPCYEIPASPHVLAGDFLYLVRPVATVEKQSRKAGTGSRWKFCYKCGKEKDNQSSQSACPKCKAKPKPRTPTKLPRNRCPKCGTPGDTRRICIPCKELKKPAPTKTCSVCGRRRNAEYFTPGVHGAWPVCNDCQGG